ncbi:MAG: hypothetical protein L3J31_05205, partial [Bacteroidales bacterium]|nr:hypothetical protein [Bacteroidales bacterium]
MKNNLLFKVLLVFLPLLSFGQQRWETILGDPDIDDYPTCITNAYDGSYLIASVSALQFNNLIKTNKNGSVLWNKAFKSSGSYLFSSVISGNDAGQKVIVGDVNNHAFIWLLNACGDLIWCNEFINNEKYIQSNYRDVVLLEDKIIVLGYFVEPDYNNIGYLVAYDYDGNLLWMKKYFDGKEDPLLDGFFSPYPLQKVSNNYFISGVCYYAYPDNPNLMYLRAMFIKVDSLFDKKWLLPYGMQDSLFAVGRGVIKLDAEKFRGYASYFIDYTDTLNSIFMDFDTDGIETGYKGIPNNTISPEVKDNDLRTLNLINDSTYLITAAVGPIPETVNPMGEWTMDSSGTVYNYQNHPGVSTPLNPTINTVDNKFMFMGRIQNTTMDILLYKLNADLSQAAYDTNTYVYDSLCDDLPIVSDTIYLDNCSIITDMEEIPTPQEYYSFITTIPVHIFPNPATSGITF